MTAGLPVHAARRGAAFGALALFLGLLAVESGFWRLGGLLGSRAVIRLGEEVRLDLFTSVAHQPWSFLQQQASGSVAGRVNAAATAATAAARTMVWNVVPPCAELVGAVAVLALVDWHLAAGLVAGAILTVLCLHRLGSRGFLLHQGYHRQAAETAGSLADVLSNIGLVRAHGPMARERDRLRDHLAAERRAHLRSWMFLERLRGGHDVAFWLVTAGLLAAAVLAWDAGAITTGSVVITMTLSLRVLSGARELALSALGLAQQLGAVAEAEAALRLRPDPAAAPAVSPAPRPRAETTRGRGAIELQAVRYAPPDTARPLLRDLSLHIPSCQRVGIAGPSGAGKSTLLRLIQGLVAPDAGRVLLDGHVLTGAAAEAAHFAVVSQEVPLFHRSLAENLWHSRPDASWDEVLAASQAAGCDSFVRALPQGYDTVIGERGMRLSGGQRQRVAVARALLRQAPVLLLDEATSALDSRAELDVQQAVLDLAGRCTVISVAHRLSTLMDMDRVIVLQDGQVAEDGPPATLRRGAGWFAATWQLQQCTLEIAD